MNDPDASTDAILGTPLLERGTELEQLARLLDAARDGRGSLILLGGSAGIGKTSVARTFSRMAAGQAQVLTGACDPLSAKEPLAPLFDIAASLGGRFARLTDRAEPRLSRFRAFLDLLSAHRPTLAIFEDVHWADDATLDLLRFAGRRIDAVPAVFVVTYRSDEVGPGHPLRVVFGDLASLRATVRIELAPLSEEAVRLLAEGSDLDPEALHRRTGGNPFFVTEVLAAGGRGIPATVRDAVLARAARLSPEGRAALDAAAVAGSPAELWLLERLLGERVAGLTECVEAGMLQASDNALSFRHEIARETVLAALPLPARIDLHRRVLAALEDAPDGHADISRLAHHADEGGLRDAVLTYAPAAARQAAELGAHREAAAQFGRALRWASGLEPAQRARLLDDYAYQCSLIDRFPDAIVANQGAIDIYLAIGDKERASRAYCRQSRALTMSGRNAEGREMCQAAIDILADMPPGPDAAYAYMNLAYHQMLDRDNAEAIAGGERAIELARQFDSIPTLTQAYNAAGSALILCEDYERGLEYLEMSLRLAETHRLDQEVGAAYGNAGSGLGEMHQFATADTWIARSLSFAEERDLDFQRHYMLAWRAISHMHQGRWDDATLDARQVLRHPDVAAVSRIMALVALGRVRARRGDPDALTALDEALELASRTETLQRLAPVRAARAEAAWLRGGHEQVRDEARAVYDLAVSKRHPWFAGELAYWQWKAGDLGCRPELAAEPYALQMAGDWSAAAERWRALNCPYEAARALAESDDEEALRLALEEFDRLGAAPARAEAARRLRELGVASIPRGARPSTQANPAGLTNRQLEVARLIAAGDGNAEIAARLFISPKTVEHHISAIFAKLDVDNRVDAALAIERLGLGPAE